MFKRRRYVRVDGLHVDAPLLHAPVVLCQCCAGYVPHQRPDRLGRGGPSLAESGAAVNPPLLLALFLFLSGGPRLGSARASLRVTVIVMARLKGRRRRCCFCAADIARPRRTTSSQLLHYAVRDSWLLSTPGVSRRVVLVLFRAVRVVGNNYAPYPLLPPGLLAPSF